jgi:hypothetical protein
LKLSNSSRWLIEARGLPWAARASCLFAAATIVIEGEEDDHVPVSFIPTLKIWAWLTLELRHLPDLLFAIQLLNGALMGLPLTEDSKEKVREDIRELELALGGVFLNLTDADLRPLANVADVLEPLGLFTARAALLYTLGYAEKLREDGSLPKEETDEAVNRMFAVLASQPVARKARGAMILDGLGGQCLTTTVLGLTVAIRFDGALRFVLLAEAVLGSLDAFFATTLEQQVIPHTEKFFIDLVESA